MRRSVPRWLPAAAKVLLVLGSMAAVLLLGEVVVRVAGLSPHAMAIVLTSDESPFERSSNPILRYELKANYRGDGTNERYPSRTNAHGQRDIERELAKPSDLKRILLLGDSVVQGVGLAHVDDTISRQLERQFAEDGARVEVLNFGVAGYCTLSEIELLKVKGLAFDPDIVIVVFTENDFTNFNPEADPITTPRPAVFNHLFAYSALFRIAAVHWNLVGFGAQSDPLAWNSGAIGDNNVVDGLAQLRRLADRDGFRVLLAVWPTFHNDDTIDVLGMPDGSGELIVERLARLHGIPVVRLSYFFREHRASLEPDSNPRLLYTTGDIIHPSALGSEVAARGLHATLGDLDHPGVRLPPTAPFAAAVAAARSAGEKDRPTYFRSKVNEGNVAFEAGQLQEAESLFEEARDLRPDLPGGYFNLGVVYQHQGRVDEAERAYAAAAERDVQHYVARLNLGILLARRGEYARAESMFREVIGIMPELANGWFDLGAAQVRQGKLDQAVASFEKTLELEPGHELARQGVEQVRQRLREATAPSAP